MLILTRKPGETVRIGDEITVTLLGIQGLQARVGIQAPTSVEVHRHEIYDRIQAERSAQQQPSLQNIPEVTPEMNIEDRAALVLDAARYRHLRNRVQVEDPDTDLLVMAGATYFTGTELDKTVDDAMRLEALEAEACAS